MNRELVLVLGMHRSGTSTVTGLLVRLGAQGPASLTPGGSANPEGYWESAVLHEFHERLLRAAGTRWDTYTRLNPDWFHSPAASELHDEGHRLFREEFGDAARCVLKDPRVCRFVPFWARIADAEGATLTAVLVIRHPLEVARSLNARDGFETNLSLLLWLRHVLDAELATRFIRRSVVRYEDVLEDWAEVAEGVARDLSFTWPARSAADDVEIARFVKPSLRHHRASSEDLSGHVPRLGPALGEWVRQTSTAMSWLHDHKSDRAAEAREVLDGVRLDFDRATEVFGELTDSRHVALQSAVGNLQGVVDSLHDRAAELEVSGAKLRAGLSNLQGQADGLVAELAAVRRDAQALRDSMSWRLTAPLRVMFRWVK